MLCCIVWLTTDLFGILEAYISVLSLSSFCCVPFFYFPLSLSHSRHSVFMGPSSVFLALTSKSPQTFSFIYNYWGLFKVWVVWLLCCCPSLSFSQSGNYETSLTLEISSLRSFDHSQLLWEFRRCFLLATILKLGGEDKLSLEIWKLIQGEGWFSDFPLRQNLKMTCESTADRRLIRSLISRATRFLLVLRYWKSKERMAIKSPADWKLSFFPFYSSLLTKFSFLLLSFSSRIFLIFLELQKDDRLDLTHGK